MSGAWLELESDPGVFTLLVEEFGVTGVQVEEVYDLQKAIDGPVYGFIFLFKWIEERRSRRKVQPLADEAFITDEDALNRMFFAQQLIPNSCATHALLSVLLNCPEIQLGPTLTYLKEFTQNFSPESKGYAIGSMGELARAHNSHAKPEPRPVPEKQTGISAVKTAEAFHFVSYVPVNGRLFELDGLKPYPIDHGPWSESEVWTDKFRRVISDRLALGGCDIRFSLMAVVAGRRQQYEQKLSMLRTNRKIILESLQQLVRSTHPNLLCSPGKSSPVARPPAEQEAGGASGGGTSNSKQQAQPLQLATRNRKSKKKRLMEIIKIPEKVPLPKPNSNRLPAALDNHNYCKSPLSEHEESSLGTTEDEDPEAEGPDRGGPAAPSPSGQALADDPASFGVVAPEEEEARLDPSLEVPKAPSVPSAAELEAKLSGGQRLGWKGEGSAAAAAPPTDYSQPLTIQTSFRPEPPSPAGSGNSTDTASEMGSAFNSPLRSTTPSRANSPSYKMHKFHQWKAKLSEAREKLEKSMTSDPHAAASLLQIKTEAGEGAPPAGGDPSRPRPEVRGELLVCRPSPSSAVAALSGPHTFQPKDLLALLKTVEVEISSCEQLLRDEIEKRKKYRVDDCRRSHNYDAFICSFLTILADQGMLPDLVDQHSTVKRRQGNSIGRLQKRRPDRRRRSRPAAKKTKK